jgi:hypothetical protein
MRHSLGRRIIALAAAYAVGLNALLPVLALDWATTAWASVGIICSPEGADAAVGERLPVGGAKIPCGSACALLAVTATAFHPDWRTFGPAFAGVTAADIPTCDDHRLRGPAVVDSCRARAPPA